MSTRFASRLLHSVSRRISRRSFLNQRAKKRSYVCCDVAATESLEQRLLLTNFAVGDQLRNYRVAIASTAEMTAHLGGQAATLVTIQNIVSTFNSTFEKEASVHFDLVSGNNLIFTDTATDGYTNPPTGSSTSTLLNQNQVKIDATLGSAAYDVGMVIGYDSGGGSSGRAGLRTVSQTGSKARNATIGSDPTSAGFLGVMIHELGHQFNMGHTFNGLTGNCGGSNWSSSSAVEPGAGSTIMAYNGICGADDLPSDGPEVFHSFSYEQLNAFVTAASNPATPFSTTTISNAIPTVAGGPDYVIPANTPFELTATGSDANAGDSLSYTWEQIDVATAQQALPVSDTGSNPIFRSFSPKLQSNRVFPRLTDLIANTGTAGIGEALPTTNRDLDFRVTIRDGSGGVNSDDVQVTSHNTGSAFSVSSPNTATTWTGGTSQTVTWNVAGTTAAPISAANVDILLSSDGGLTYPIVLATGVANDGSQAVTVPNLDATQARVKVRGSGNVFFDISNANFTINANSAAPGVTIVESGGTTRVGEGTIQDSYTIALNTAPAGTVTVQLAADSQTEISTNGINFGSSQTVVLSSTTPQTIHVRATSDAAEEGSHSSLITHVITASTSATYSMTLALPPISVAVIDSALPPVIGLDVGFSDSAQPFWANQNFLSGSHSNISEDDGTPTTVDLSISYSGGGNSSSGGITASQLPRHNQSLISLGGFGRSTGNVNATWSGLDAGQKYAVYIFGFESSTGTYTQTVSVSGATSLPSFTQTLSNGVLMVNDELGTDSRTLQSYDHVVEATAGGVITVSLSPGAGSAGVALAGIAIRPVLEAPTNPALADKIGVHRGTIFYRDVTGNGQWDGTGAGDAVSSFQGAGTPLVGDWNGDGFDEIGVHIGRDFYLDTNGNGVWDGTAGGDTLHTFGIVGDTPITGDWDGNGTDSIGVHRGRNFYRDVNGNGMWDGIAVDALSAFGIAGDTPIIGDWNGNGTDSIGIHRGRTFYRDLNGNGIYDNATDDAVSVFGIAGDTPIIGDWNGSGADSIGVHRGRLFYRDVNGNGAWDGAGIDTFSVFGIAGDTPITGLWSPGAANGAIPQPQEISDPTASDFTLDANNDGRMDALGDGIGFLRYLAGFQDDSFRYGASEREMFMDVDGDGTANALTDGLLITRYLAGFRGRPLIEAAVSSNGIRQDAASIATWLQRFMPAEAIVVSPQMPTENEDPIEDLIGERPDVQVQPTFVEEDEEDLSQVSIEDRRVEFSTPANDLALAPKVVRDTDIDQVFQDLLTTGL